MRQGWDTTLDLQTDLIASAATRDGRAYLDGLAASMGRAGQWDTRTGEVAPPNPEYAALLVNATMMMLPNADPFYISDELTELVDIAAESFKPEPLIITDLTVPAGFAFFGQPFHIKDTNGITVPYRAMSWNPVSDHRTHASGLPMPVDATNDQPKGVMTSADGQRASYDEEPPNLSGILFGMYQHCEDPDAYAEHHDILSKPGPVGGSKLTLSYVTAISFNANVKYLDRDQSIMDMHAHLKTFFRLCQQQIAVPRYERVARPVFKRAARRWKPIRQVVVFTLRRAKPPQYEGPEREVHWTHRWIVQGHWRNQWYPSEKTHRQVWIAPFVKGPNDKPLIFKRRAFELIR